MVTKAELDAVMKKLDIMVADELPGKRGGWFYSLAGMESRLFDGRADAVLAGLLAAEELERLVAHFK
jgi:hypothetical protein